MQYAENILGTIGNTPLVKLNKVTEGIDALVPWEEYDSWGGDGFSKNDIIYCPDWHRKNIESTRSFRKIQGHICMCC